MASLMDRFEERATAMLIAAMRAALWQEYIFKTAAACHIRSVPSPDAYLSAHTSLHKEARRDCINAKNMWREWFLDMQSTHNLTIAPMYYADMDEVLTASDERDRDLLCAWGKLRAVSVQCGMELLTSPLVARRIFIAKETARLYALRNVFMD